MISVKTKEKSIKSLKDEGENVSFHPNFGKLKINSTRKVKSKNETNYQLDSAT